METLKLLENRSAEHGSELIDRITALRLRWLSHVETQLALQQSRRAHALDRYKLGADAAE